LCMETSSYNWAAHRHEKLFALKQHSIQNGRGFIWEISDWMDGHYEIPLIATVVYVIFVYFGQKYMEKRQAFELNTPLAIWNFILAVFSVYGAYIITPMFFQDWINGKGFIHEMCTGDVETYSPWTMYFCLSKIPELLDTVFIVLRKRPLRFLQYYHHIATMWFCWAAWARKLECGGTFAVMNLLVHSVMYTYFMCSALHIKWPEWARQSITLAQLSQMFFGMGLVLMSIYFCPADPLLLFCAFIMYISYFILFAQLFYSMYLTKPLEGIKKKSQ